MLIRQPFKNENGEQTACRTLLESSRTERWPQQRVVAWLGKLDEKPAGWVCGSRPNRPMRHAAHRKMVLKRHDQAEAAFHLYKK